MTSQLRKPSEGPYFWITKSVWRKIRSIAGENNVPSLASVLVTYAVLAEMASDAQSARFEALRGEIASRAGLGIRTIDPVFCVLEKAGVLCIDRRKIDSAMNLPSIYSLLACSAGTKSGGSATIAPPSATIAPPSATIAPPSATIAPLVQRTNLPPLRTVLNESKKESKNIAPPASPDVANDLLEALAKAEGSDPAQLTEPARKRIAAAVAQLLAVAPDLTPDEITRRARVYPRVMPPGSKITAHAISMNWAKCCGERALIEAVSAAPEPAKWRELLEAAHPGNAINRDGRPWRDVPAGVWEKVISAEEKTS